MIRVVLWAVFEVLKIQVVFRCSGDSRRFPWVVGSSHEIRRFVRRSEIWDFSAYGIRDSGFGASVKEFSDGSWAVEDSGVRKECE